jgi:hypothetical protein
MELLQMWTAVGEQCRFRRILHGRTAHVFRRDEGWGFVVSDGESMITRGRAASWDEATSRAQAVVDDIVASTAPHSREDLDARLYAPGG